MTREEAIEIIKYSIGVLPVTDRAVSALDMAIKALKQEPCEDAISRQAAIEKIHWLGLDHDTAIKCDLAIRALPSVIPSIPTEQTEDAISRQAAVNIASGFCHPANVADELAKLPSVNPQESSDISNDGTLTVNVEDGRKISRVLVCGANHWGGLYYPDEQEPKTGHWIAQDIHNCHTDFKCSECDYIHSFMHLYGKPTADYTYCPNCGCRMVEPQESEGEK